MNAPTTSPPGSAPGLRRNTKLCLALHALGHMASAPERMRSSVEIAAHNDTNPVVVRRVLGLLREAGLVVSGKGNGGGWRLARPAGAITLADVYGALDEPFLRPAPDDEEPDCPVRRELRTHVEGALREAEALLVDRLAAVTIERIAVPTPEPAG